MVRVRTIRPRNEMRLHAAFAEGFDAMMATWERDIAAAL
jgi:hypothetical protein